MMRLGCSRDLDNACVAIRVYYPTGVPATLAHDIVNLSSGGDGYAVDRKVWTHYDIVFERLRGTRSGAG